MRWSPELETVWSAGGAWIRYEADGGLHRRQVASLALLGSVAAGRARADGKRARDSGARSAGYRTDDVIAPCTGIPPALPICSDMSNSTSVVNVADPPTGTVAFLFTDIEDSSEGWEQQPRAMAVAVARHDALLQSIITAHHGYVFKTVGDAFCAAFTSVDAAVRAALAAQRVLAAEPGERDSITMRSAVDWHCALLLSPRQFRN